MTTAPRTSPVRRCRLSLRRLSMYLDGELDTAGRREIERHLRECACCREALADLERAVALCRDAGVPALPADVRARARARVLDLLRRSCGKAIGARGRPHGNARRSGRRG